MKRIIIVHTVKNMYLTYEQRIRKALDCEVKIDNILDTYFANHPNEVNEFTIDNFNRLYLTLKSAETTNPDVIVVACSSISPYVEKLKPLFKVPIVRIDERIGSEAIKYGSKITIMAHAPSAIEPTKQIIESAALKANLSVDIETSSDIEAFRAMMNGDIPLMEERIFQNGRKIKERDVIVFAQGSMEGVASKVEQVTGIPVVTAPELCIKQVKEIIEGGK